MFFIKKMTLSARIVRLSREGLWTVIGQIAAVLGSLLGIRLLTELMDPRAYGELALGMTVAAFVNQTVFGPLSNGANRFFAPAAAEEELSGYLRSVGRLAAIATGVVALMTLVVFLGLLLGGHDALVKISLTAFALAPLAGYNVILGGIHNAARQRLVVALHQGVEPWARFSAAAVAVWWLGATGAVAMLGYVFATICVLGSQLYFFRRTFASNDISDSETGRWTKQLVAYTWPFASWGVFSWAQQVSDRWSLNSLASSQEVGLYAVLYQLGYYPMALFTGMAVQFASPILYQRIGDARDKERNKEVGNLSLRLTFLSLALTFLASVAGWVLHEWIFDVLVSKTYASVSYLLPWMVAASGIFAAGQISTLNLMSQLKTRSMIAAKIVTSLLGVIFSIAGAYWYGIPGVVAASVGFSSVYLVWMLALSRS